MLESMADDDIPQLSAETFAALQEFYREQDKKRVEELHTDSVEENWQLSQFWYDETTISALSQIAVDAAGKYGKVALVSCPSLYKKTKELSGQHGEVTVFEFDERFSIFGQDFVFYDYREPTNIPQDRINYYDIVIVDPPFLSEECLTKTAETIKLLAKGKILLCTGATMSDLAEKLLNLKKTGFEPRHTNNLANEFWCYSNFDIDKLLKQVM